LARDQVARGRALVFGESSHGQPHRYTRDRDFRRFEGIRVEDPFV